MNTKTFTHPIIKGIYHKKTLPPGIGLVLEGGGTRGLYSSGVFEAFMDEGIIFPYIVGVSAGAANALTYISGQPGRSRQIVEHYVGDKKHVSRRNLLRYGTLFGYNFIFNTIPNRHIFWDREVFDSTDIRFLTGATDCNTGRAVWFEKDELAEDFIETIASCSVPIVARIVKHKGMELLDGGISMPIPIEKSIEDGNHFHVIVLTRNPGFEHKPFEHKRFLKLFYRKYPNFVDTMMARHEIYNRQLALCEKLERENKALIIRPQTPLVVDRATSDTVKLLALYDQGHAEGAEAVIKLREIGLL
jgi:predicted patatin/cPLA2 family phospholipase